MSERIKPIDKMITADETSEKALRTDTCKWYIDEVLIFHNIIPHYTEELQHKLKRRFLELPKTF